MLTFLTEAPNVNSGLSGAGQADWILRYGLAAVYIRETHAAELLRFV